MTQMSQSKKRLLNIWVRQITPQEPLSPTSLRYPTDEEATLYSIPF